MVYLMPDFDELERLARAATPGPWELWLAYDARPHDVVGPVSWKDPKAQCGRIVSIQHSGATDTRYGPEQSANAAFIAAANPATVLALLDENERLRGLWTTLRGERRVCRLMTESSTSPAPPYPLPNRRK